MPTRSASVPLVLALTAACHRSASNSLDPNEQDRIIEFTSDRLTHSNVDVSPDGKTIIFDGLGDVFTVPIGGGKATALLIGNALESNPHFSPDGTEIGFRSDREGSLSFWIAKLDGSAARRLGDVDSLLRMSDSLPASFPRWVIDGRHGAGRRDTALRMAINVKSLPTKEGMVFAQSDGADRMRLVLKPASGDPRTIVDSLTPIGDNYPRTGGIPDYGFTPDGRAVILSRLGYLTRVELASGKATRVPLTVSFRMVLKPLVSPPRATAPDSLVSAKLLRWPTISWDGRRIVVAALNSIYLVDPKTGKANRLDPTEENEYAPAISPDGNSVAFVTWSDSSLGAVMVHSLVTNQTARVTTAPGRYANPTWSPDGTKLAFVLDDNVIGQYGPASDSFRVVWASLTDSSTPTQVAATRRYGIGRGTRFYPPLSFNATGDRIFFSDLADSADRQASDRSYQYYQRAASVRLDGTDYQVHAKIFPAVDEIVVSPRGNFVAVSRQERVLVFRIPTIGPALVRFDTGAAPTPDLSENGGTYLSWQDDTTVVWGATNEVHRIRVNGKHELVATVRIDERSPIDPGVMALVNANVLSMRNEKVFRGTILIKGNRIIAVGPASKMAVPAEARVVDAAGLTIMPGLGDMHAHIHDYPMREIFPERRYQYLASLAYGVTTVFDPATALLDAFALDELVRSGRMVGPRISASGYPQFGGEGWGPEHADVVQIASLEHARAVVRRNAKYRPGLLKEYRQPDRRQRQWIAQAAREEKVRLTAEGRDVEDEITLVLDGYTAFEHGTWARDVYDDVVQLFAKSGTSLTPTLLVALGGMDLETHYGQIERPEEDPKMRRLFPEYRLAKFEKMKTRPEAGSNYQAWLEQGQVAARVAQAGGSVSTGSHGILPGLSTHWEMWGLVEAGMTPYQALRAATVGPARKLGVDQEVGTIEPGKLADLVILTKNPLDDIRNSVAIKYVVANGVLYDAETMERVWPMSP